MEDSTAKPNENALFASSLENMRRSLIGFEKASLRLTSGSVQPEALVTQLEVKVLLKANAAAMRAAEEMIGSLFDEKA